MSGYNGFTNYETWKVSVSLLVDKEYGPQVRAMRDEIKAEETPEFSLAWNLEGYVVNLEDATPFRWRGAHLAMVRWQEIAAVLESDQAGSFS